MYSGFPGGVRTFLTGGDEVSPKGILGAMQATQPPAQGAGFKVRRVKVETFDLSDPERVRAYESLWAELLEKSGRMEVVVDSRKDLVHRADGTSYWLKYVEYVEFGDADDSAEDGKDGNDGKKGKVMQ